LSAVDVELAYSVEVQSVTVESCTLNQILPDLDPVVAEGLVLQCDRNPAVESLVESAHAVGGQEHHAVVLLQQTQENADHGVAVNVIVRPFLQEDVGFIEKHYRIPHAGHLQNLAQFLLQLSDGGAQLSYRDTLQRFSQQLAYGFCCQGFSSAGRTVQQENAAPTLATDDVFERPLVVSHQTFYQVFPVLGHHQFVVCIGVKLYFIDMFNRNFSPFFAAEWETLNGGPTLVQFFFWNGSNFAFVSFVAWKIALVRIHFSERAVVDHDASGRFVLDYIAPGVLLDAVSLGSVVGPDPILLKLCPPFL